jgi:hypothetical protein
MRRTFGKFNDQSTPLLVLGTGLCRAAIFSPSCDQGNPEPGQRGKDGFARKHYAIRWIGPARFGAPCTQLGLYGSAQEVIRIVKKHLDKVQYR